MLTNITFVVAILVASTPILLAADMVRCKGVEIKVHDPRKESIIECAAFVGIKDKASATPDQIACMAKCAIERSLLVDKIGKPHKENIFKDVEMTIPDTLKAELTAETAKCLDAHGIKLDPSEASCSTYAPLAVCLNAIWTDFCN